LFGIRPYGGPSCSESAPLADPVAQTPRSRHSKPNCRIKAGILSPLVDGKHLIGRGRTATDVWHASLRSLEAWHGTDGWARDGQAGSETTSNNLGRRRATRRVIPDLWPLTSRQLTRLGSDGIESTSGPPTSSSRIAGIGERLFANAFGRELMLGVVAVSIRCPTLEGRVNSSRLSPRKALIRRQGGVLFSEMSSSESAHLDLRARPVSPGRFSKRTYFGPRSEASRLVRFLRKRAVANWRFISSPRRGRRPPNISAGAAAMSASWNRPRCPIPAGAPL
jgi:hypothetical protein